MNIRNAAAPELPRGAEAFAQTHWSMVAALRSGSDDSQRALTQLCLSYWFPVYAYVRRCGHAPSLAQQITQAFFGDLIDAMRRDDPRAVGQFRQFLLNRLARFLGEGWANQRPGQPDAKLSPPLALEDLESRLQIARAEGSPEHSFQRGFALEVLDRAMNRLRIEAQQGGRQRMFELLEPYLTCEPEPGQYQHLADQLHSAPMAVVVAIKRLRQRFRELVDDELTETVASAEELDAERDALLAILGDAR